MACTIIIFLGDFRQLECTKGLPLYVKPGAGENEFTKKGYDFYTSIENVVILHQQMRVKKVPRLKPWIEGLNQLSDGLLPPGSEFYKIIESRFTTRVSEEELARFDDATYTAFSNADVDSHNRTYVFEKTEGPIRVIQAKNWPASDIGRAQPDSQCGGLPNKLYLVRGLKVRLRSNLWVPAGMANNVTGEIYDIIDEPGKPYNALPRFVLVKLDWFRGPSALENIPNIVVLKPDTKDMDKIAGGKRCMIPLKPAKGGTFHFLQGKTKDQMMINLNDANSKGDPNFARGGAAVANGRMRDYLDALWIPFPEERLTKLGADEKWKRLRKEVNERLPEIFTQTKERYKALWEELLQTLSDDLLGDEGIKQRDELNQLLGIENREQDGNAMEVDEEEQEVDEEEQEVDDEAENDDEDIDRFFDWGDD